MLPEERVGFVHYLGIFDDDAREFGGCQRKGHGHTVVAVGVDAWSGLWLNGFEVPLQGIVAFDLDVITQFAQFRAQCLEAVALLDA